MTYKYFQGKCTVQKAKGLNPQPSFMRPRDLERFGCLETKAWILSAWTENDAHMALRVRSLLEIVQYLSGFVQVLLRLSSLNPTSSTP